MSSRFLAALVIALAPVVQGQTAFSPDSLGITFGAGFWSPAHLNADARGDMVSALVSPGGAVTVLTTVSSGATGWNGIYGALAGMPSLSGMLAGDLDHDGLDDLVMSSAAPALALWTWLGNGAGTFPSGSATGISGFGLFRAADFDGDGNLDVLGVVAAGVQVALGNGLGGLSPGPVLALPAAPDAGAVADIDGDGDLDLVLSVPPAVRVFLNQGNAVFAPGATLASVNQAVPGLVLADVDGVNGPDLAWIAGIPTLPLGLGVRLNDGTGAFGVQVSASIPTPGAWSGRLRGADLDQDGFDDLVLLRTSAGPGSGLWHAAGRSSGLFPLTDVLLAPAAVHTGLEPFDWDGDGDTDLVLRAPGSPYEIALNLVAGSHAGCHGAFLGGCLPGPPPALRLTGGTAPGRTATLTTTGGQAGASALLLLGLVPGRIENPLLYPGCFLGVADWPTAFLLPRALDAQGSAALSFVLPVAPALTGTRFVVQDLLTGLSTPIGIDATNALLVIAG